MVLDAALAVPQDLFILIGAGEFRGGAGDDRSQTELTSFAAFGLALVMILAAVFTIVRVEYNSLPINLLLGGGAAFTAYGRLLVRPIAPAPISTFCVLK
jgi:hypothetical protein